MLKNESIMVSSIKITLRRYIMFCEKCGAQLPDDAKFCEKCGSSTVPGAAPAPAAAAVAAAAVAPAAPKAPSAFSLALKKFFSNKRNVIIAAIALFLVIAIIVAIIIIASQPKKIYIDDYFHVVFEGVDGSGHAYLSTDEEEMKKMAKLNKKLFGDDADEESIGRYLTPYIDMTEEELHSLKNGQKIKIKLKINKEIYDEVDGYKFVLRNKTVKVKGLYKSTQLNVLDYVKPGFSGYDGFGELNSSDAAIFPLINGVEARVNSSYSSMMIEFYETSTGSYLASVSAYFDKYENLSNNDKITASFNASDYSTEALYRKFGIILASQTKEYTVSGLTESFKVDPTKYVTPTYDGISSVATMNLSVSSASVTAGNYTIEFTDRSGSYYREFNVDILNENGSSVRTLTYSADKYDYLKNGDKIKFTAYADFKSIVNQYGIALPETFEVEVSGLNEPFNANPVERGTYSFTGYEGYGKFAFTLPEENRVFTTDDGKYTIKLALTSDEWNHKLTVVVADENGRNFLSFYYNAYLGDSLRNGDKVYFNCSELTSELNGYVKDYGIYFPSEVIYTVEGLSETTMVSPLDNVTFAFAKDGDYIKMTLGLKENVITVGDNTVNLSLETYSSWGYKYTKVNVTVKDKDGKTVGTGYYQFQADHLYEGDTVWASDHISDSYAIAQATGITFNTESFTVIVSSM